MSSIAPGADHLTDVSAKDFRAIRANLDPRLHSGSTRSRLKRPTVNAQPRSETVYAGQVARFTAHASGTPVPTVRWQDRHGSTGSWKKIRGAIAKTYSFTASRSKNHYEYRAIFRNSVGTAATHAATLTVKLATAPRPNNSSNTAAPVVTRQPASQTVTRGDTATFRASASGNPTPAVHWQISTDRGLTWANTADATSTTYSFRASASDNGDEYRAVFTNSAGSTTTTPASLTVTGVAINQTTPTTGGTTTTGSASFTDQLEPTTENGTSVTFVTTTSNAHLQVSATGAVTTSGGPLAAGSSTVSGTDFDTLGDTGPWSYTLTVTGVTINQIPPTTGSTTTATSSFTDQLEPTTENGTPVTFVTTTANAHLQVSATGAVTTSGGPLAAGSSTVSGTDSDTLGDTGTWSYTLTVTVTGVTAQPVVTEQPTNDTVATGNQASFSAAASGTPAPTVQWQVSSNRGNTWQDVTGATSTTYSFTAWSSQNGYEYQAAFTNSVGNATTNPATLTVEPSQSSNWSGYVDTGGTFSSVSGDWTVPTVTCATRQTEYSAAWIGIDGDSSSTVEQDGTESDCDNGTPSYYAWYEMYGDSAESDGDEVELPDPVSPGDQMSATVSVTGDEWTLAITDLSSSHGWIFSTDITFSGAVQSSAEWIVERPEICYRSGCSLTSLASFGSVTFTGGTTTEDGASGPISAFSPSAMEMVSSSVATVLAAPGSLDSTGEGFTDEWEATGP
jgi:hypothetical protein